MPRVNYENLVFPALRRIDAERAHRAALSCLKIASSTPIGLPAFSTYAPEPDPRLAVKPFGLTFRNPLGVGAGLDKEAEAIAALFALGFGAVETGTVTPLPQPGNPRPRIWRLPEQRAVINSMGFPSHGAQAVRNRLLGKDFDGVLGINLGKNLHTPVEDAISDYLRVVDALWPFANYLTINVSSPNTPGLRQLQDRDALTELVGAVRVRNIDKAEIYGLEPKPILVKIAPDLDDADLDDVLVGALDGRAAGLIISNTTTDRSVLGSRAPGYPGGISGKPLKAKATELTRKAARRLGSPHRLPIVGVGGIATAADVVERMQAGASLVQIYTAFIYAGPSLPGRILRDLSAWLDREGIGSIEEIIGQDT